MSSSNAGRIVVVAALAAVLGVVAYSLRESPQAKAERLRREMDEACYGVVVANLRGGMGSPEERAACDVATREFNKFMGR